MKNDQIKVPQKPIPSTNEAVALIQELQLQPHPEGGWFREVYRSDETLRVEALPERYNKDHNYSTSIYFLLESHDFSAFHRIRSDETWHFYKGSPLVILIISPDGVLKEITMGNTLYEGQTLQYTIMRNCWFAALLMDENSFSLVGCTVSPGFEFEDFELGRCEKLTELFPLQAEVIRKLTRI